MESGNVQAEGGETPSSDGKDTLRAPTLVGEMCNEFSSLPKSPNSACMPICFLVREQAKSLVAIQNLQKRIKNLEGTQSDVISAISEVHDLFSVNGINDGDEQLSSPRNFSSTEKPKQLSSPPKNKLVKSSVSLSPCVNKSASFSFSKSNPELYHPKLSPQGIQSKDAPESDKQDSGLDSDCRDQGLESNVPSSASLNKQLPENNSDELLDLLDEISHKSEILCQHVSADERQFSTPQFGAEINKSHHEYLELQKLLSDIKGERQHVDNKMVNLESSATQLAVKNNNLHKDFLTLLVEKRKIETKLQSFSELSCKINDPNCTDSSTPGSDMKHPFFRGIHKMDTGVVSAVLKENNLLDLQKQVLTYFMENEILRSKIDQIEQWYASKDLEKECFEKVAKEEIRELMSDNERLRISLEEQKLESAALKAKVRMLERVLQSVTLENRELNLQLGETFYLQDALRGAPSHLAERVTSVSSAGVSRRFSLPAQSRTERDLTVTCNKAKLSPNGSSFIDVTIDEPESSDELAVTMEQPAFNFSQHRSSTPMNLSKKHLKFADMANTPSVRFNKSGGSSPSKQIHKRLSFSGHSQTNKVIPSFKEFMKNTSFNSSACDNSKYAPEHLKTLDMIEEKAGDPKSFPFYSILEKLKAGSSYKFPSKASEDQGLIHDNPAHGSLIANNSKAPDPMCNNPGSLIPQEYSKQTKEHSSTTASNHTKTIHKRIQDILDRITSEAEEAVV